MSPQAGIALAIPGSKPILRHRSGAFGLGLTFAVDRHWRPHVLAGRYRSLLPADAIRLCRLRATLLRRPISMLTINGSRLSKTFCLERSTRRLPSKGSPMRLNNSRRRPSNLRIHCRQGIWILKNGIVAGPLGTSVFFRSLCAAPHRKSFQSLCRGKLLVDRGRPRLRPVRFLLPAIA